MAAVLVPEATATRPVWLQGPTHDLAMAFVWVPFALAAHVVANDPEPLRWLVSATLLFSFAHQPLTLWLAYGDAGQRRAHRALFGIAPLVLVPVVVLGSSVRPELVALVAGIWNVGHTIRQRYGISRLYGRMTGVDCGADNRLLWSWLSVAALVAVAATDLSETARDLGLSRRNTAAMDTLDSARALALALVPVAVATAVVVTRQAVRDERRREDHSTARLAYLGSTALLLVVLAVEPVTGFVAYVGAHAAEYLFVVRWRIGRAAQRVTPRDGVGALARRVGGGGTLLLYVAAVIVLIVSLRSIRGSDVTGAVVLTLGALHLLYDGFIWRAAAPAKAP